jgi:hypothetical protein
MLTGNLSGWVWGANVGWIGLSNAYAYVQTAPMPPAPTRVIRLEGDLAFGAVEVGSSTQRVLRIWNDGNSALTVSGIAYPTGFSGAWSRVVPTGTYQEVAVTFAPLAARWHGGLVRVSSDATSGTASMACSGVGRLPLTHAIRLEGNLAFGNVTVGTSTQRILRIRNLGNAPLQVTGVACPAGFSGAWTGTIAKAGYRDVPIRFAPTATRWYGGNIVVSSDATTGTGTKWCSGTGVPPRPPRPVGQDYDGDRWSDLAVYERATGNWYVRSLRPGVAPPVFGLRWGGSGADPVGGDYNGDGKWDLAVYERLTGNWYIRSLRLDLAVILFGFNWGGSTTDPVAGDYDGDGRWDLAVYDRWSGHWYIRTLRLREPPIVFGLKWGDSGMDPVSGDYDGDGKADLAVYERLTGRWYIRSLRLGAPPIAFGLTWGNAGMVPVPGDYDGDGKWDLAVYERLTGNWYVRPVRAGAPAILFGLNWGGRTTDPVGGDYDGDGKWDLAAYERATGLWFVRTLRPGAPPIAVGLKWGDAGMVPVGGR